MGYKKGVNRYQVNMFPPTYEELVPQDSEVRLIDAFVNSLTHIRFQYTVTPATGNNPYDPLDMVKIFVYGYLNKIRSSRCLETACNSHIPLIWLINGIKPTSRTISNFRKNNNKQLKQVLKEFNLICKHANLFNKELVAIDGTKIEACTSKDNVYTKEQLKEKIKKINKDITAYLEEVKYNDRIEEKIPRATSEDVLNAISNLEKDKEYFENLFKEMEEQGEKQVSLGDPDCRIMSQRNKKTIAGYNVQIATEVDNKMIVDFEVTNHGNDEKELSNMAIKAKEELGVDKLEVIADAGYECREEFGKCVENNITPYTFIKKSVNNNKGCFKKEDFIYDPKRDVYICPAQRELVKVSNHWNNVRKLNEYEYRDRDKCIDCPLKSQCTKSKTRKICRWENEHIVDNMRGERGKELLKKRKSTAEPPIGVLKRDFGFSYFLTRGFENVSTEFSLMALVYNMRRAINLLGVPKLIQLIKSYQLTKKIA